MVWFILRVDEVPGSIPGTDPTFLQFAPLARCIIMYINQEASSHTSLVFPMVFLISGVVWFAHLMLQIQSSGSGEGSPSSPCGDCWCCYTITVTLDLALLLLTFEMMIISWHMNTCNFQVKSSKSLSSSLMSHTEILVVRYNKQVQKKTITTMKTIISQCMRKWWYWASSSEQTSPSWIANSFTVSFLLMIFLYSKDAEFGSVRLV